MIISPGCIQLTTDTAKLIRLYATMEVQFDLENKTCHSSQSKCKIVAAEKSSCEHKQTCWM